MERSCPTSGRPATPADINRNSRPTSIGTRGRHQSECPAGIIGIRSHQEFIRFLNTIEADIPAGKIIHVVLDNYATHKHARVRAWLDRHPRFVFHYIPTSASWLNAVEGFFAKLTKRRLKRGVFRSIVDLQAAINRFLKET